MKTIIITLTLLSITGIHSLTAQEDTVAETILEQVDRNLSAQTRIFESSMTIHGRRTSRTVTSKSWSRGESAALTEYRSPASEAGTKMLKLEDQLWIYTPLADRTIQISGHMLRQSVMGSDLSYEDMMDDRKLTEVYSAEVIAQDTLRDTRVLVLQLTARLTDVAYPTQKMWIDAEKFVPLRQEMYARSGQLLKRIDLFDVKRIQDRWFPTRMIYKDMLKTGGGTEFSISSMVFDAQIPEYIFSKASLR
ncbi:MAG: outer membrane lipoprotein-sorting protein [Bacteroidales bacterium]|jgi:outer membrane lipoprotein-sorting protein|nr:outer membrane lipoprotein-sorting protein [Bacteroidales bacterium]MDD2263555.1 outer membrane lipoprotein-sorting protein [Bacteroidales bacterium]MDD2830654.1 outer membrane lipoprotein-sorting protein [Bacteroidales bacterium]MDD3207853.1 outer membrane lipoprotein-sorting protein [Bacteroidales bacterium]MDD3696639.1 outer membrane lipoprotein-sorting protein [Bacteroidales bacterium]